MALANLFGWSKMETEKPTAACGSACGASDKPGEKPAACGSACGAGDKPAETPAATRFCTRTSGSCLRCSKSIISPSRFWAIPFIFRMKSVGG